MLYLERQRARGIACLASTILLLLFVLTGCAGSEESAAGVSDDGNPISGHIEDDGTTEPVSEDPPPEEDPPAEDPPAEDPPTEDPPVEDPPEEDPTTPTSDDDTFQTGDGCLSTVELETKIIEIVNEVRSEPRQCGETAYPAAPALEWDERLEGAARTHSKDMADNSFLRHQGTDGSFATDRVQVEGYNWRRVAENIAAGQTTIEQVANDWAQSPSHCANIMDNRYQDVGASCWDNDSATYHRYWTLVLGWGRN